MITRGKITKVINVVNFLVMIMMFGLGTIAFLHNRYSEASCWLLLFIISKNFFDEEDRQRKEKEL